MKSFDCVSKRRRDALHSNCKYLFISPFISILALLWKLLLLLPSYIFLYFHLEEISINPQTPKADYLMFRQPNFIPHLFTPISARRGGPFATGMRWLLSSFLWAAGERLEEEEEARTTGKKSDNWPERRNWTGNSKKVHHNSTRPKQTRQHITRSYSSALLLTSSMSTQSKNKILIQLHLKLIIF